MVTTSNKHILDLVSSANFRTYDWSKAVYWLDKVVSTNTEDEEGNFDGTMHDPHYQLVARQATMYSTGGFGLEKDPSKAGKFVNL